MPTALTDEQLVRGCLEGSQEAWSALIDKYKNLIFSIPIKYGFARDDAREIFQQVCLRLLSELASLRDPNSLAAWLIRVTSHDCFQWSRRQRRNDKMALTYSETTMVKDPEPPQELVLQLEREQILREALQQITPRCRELIEMLFFRTPPLPYDEVAKTLRLARGSIGFTRMRCLNQLRARLQERGF
jgi:RNA polymerase sigma factor (sigma-70 family)